MIFTVCARKVREFSFQNVAFPRGIVGIIPVAVFPEDDFAAFIIDETAMPVCTRIRRGGFGVVEAPIADTSLADGLFWPSPSSGICTTGATRWRGGRAGIPLFLVVSIASVLDSGFTTKPYHTCDGLVVKPDI